jgi:fluoroquinolone transport system permease protein
MRRLRATLWCDLRLQYRNGFYYAAAFVAALWMLLLAQVPAASLSWLLPPLVLGNLLINTFYFVAGQVLLEKGEGTLEAQVVTPLRVREYLASKALTLGALSLLEALAYVLIAYGPRFRLLPFAAGVLLISAMYVLYGFVVVARYDSINEFLFPSVLYTIGLGLPLLDYFNLVRSPLVYLHPVQAPLVLLRAAFQPVDAWQMVYGVLYAGLWVGLVYLLSRRAFLRFVVARQGVR